MVFSPALYTHTHTRTQTQIYLVSLNLLIILCTAEGEILKILAVACCGTMGLIHKYLLKFLRKFVLEKGLKKKSTSDSCRVLKQHNYSHLFALQYV